MMTTAVAPAIRRRNAAVIIELILDGNYSIGMPPPTTLTAMMTNTMHARARISNPTLVALLMRVVLLELDLLAGHLTHLLSVRSVRSGRPNGQPRG